MYFQNTREMKLVSLLQNIAYPNVLCISSLVKYPLSMECESRITPITVNNKSPQTNKYNCLFFHFCRKGNASKETGILEIDIIVTIVLGPTNVLDP